MTSIRRPGNTGSGQLVRHTGPTMFAGARRRHSFEFERPERKNEGAPSGGAWRNVLSTAQRAGGGLAGGCAGLWFGFQPPSCFFVVSAFLGEVGTLLFFTPFMPPVMPVLPGLRMLVM